VLEVKKKGAVLAFIAVGKGGEEGSHHYLAQENVWGGCGGREGPRGFGKKSAALLAGGGKEGDEKWKVGKQRS